MDKKKTTTKKPGAPTKGVQGFQPGHAKVGGRKKNTPNKVSKSVRKRLEEKMEPFIDTLDVLIAKISDPKERLDAIAKIMPYVAPKLQNIDMKSEEDRTVTVEQYLVSLDEKYSEKKAELQAKKVKLVSFD